MNKNCSPRDPVSILRIWIECVCLGFFSVDKTGLNSAGLDINFVLGFIETVKKKKHADCGLGWLQDVWVERSVAITLIAVAHLFHHETDFQNVWFFNVIKSALWDALGAGHGKVNYKSPCIKCHFVFPAGERFVLPRLPGHVCCHPYSSAMSASGGFGALRGHPFSPQRW